MPTGLATTWGYPIGSVANRFQTMVSGKHPLTYELGLSSYPPSFVNGEYESPLMSISRQNNTFPSQSAFGKKNRLYKKSLKKGSKKSSKKKIPAKIRRLCKRLGIKITRKVGKRRVNKTLKQLKKQIARKLKSKKQKKKH